MEVIDRQFLKEMSHKWRQEENAEERQRMIEYVESFTENFFYQLLPANDQTNGHVEGKGERTLRDILKIDGDHIEIGELMKLFLNEVVLQGFPAHSGRMMGMIPSTGHMVYSVGHYLASLSQKMSLNAFCSQAACDIEKSVLDWVAEMVGYPEESRGVFVSGSSMGVVLAMCAARDHKINTCQDYGSSVIYMTDQSHTSNYRAINVTGLRECILKTVPKDEYHRMAPEALEEMIAEDRRDGLSPFFILATMGTTNTGVVDPLEMVGHIARKHNIWFHIDAAYGGFLMLSDTLKHLQRGCSLSDSVTLDCHKGLGAPFGCATVMVRNGGLLKKSMSFKEAEYIPVVSTEKGYEPLDYSFEMSRPFRSFPVWFAMKYFGTEGMKDHIKEKLLLTEYAYKRLCGMADIEVFMKPDLTIIAFRCSPTGPAANGPTTNDVTRKLLNMILEEKSVFLTGTTVDGVFYIRICILSLRTHIEETELAIEMIGRKLDCMKRYVLEKNGDANMKG